MTSHLGTHALVTGAGSGNGKAIAEMLLAEGASVVLLDVIAEGIDKFAAQHPKAHAVTADVTNPESVSAAMQIVQKEYGSLDLLVNNAGIVRGSKFSDLPLAEWDEVFAVNSTGPFLVSQAAAPLLAPAPRPGETRRPHRQHHLRRGAHRHLEQRPPPGALQRVQRCAAPAHPGTRR